MMPDTPISQAGDAFQAQAACAPLMMLAAIDVRGPDAPAFLHNLLTNDVEHLDSAAARPGGFCSPKGRLLATFLYWRLSADEPQQSGVRLLLSADLQATQIKRLSMYVLRSKAKVAAPQPGVRAWGLFGAARHLRTVLAGQFDSLPDTVWGRVDGAIGTLIRLSDVPLDAAQEPVCRYLLVAPDALDLPAPLSTDCRAASADEWAWLEVRSGEARISAATAERFVPQMVNYEAIGGVNFRKGCYPGQEVVARSQYRGTVKRRGVLLHIDGPAQVGDELFLEGASEACGEIVLCAPAPGGGSDCLAELRIAARDSGAALRLGAAGLAAQRLPLPYALPTLD